MKKDAANESQQKSRKPFFARLLEEQDLGEASGGCSSSTRKYPSDVDDDWGRSVTLKYPSDGDDFSGVAS